MPDVFVQRITVSWSKSSRGAAGATMRNRVAQGFAWPAPAAHFHDVEAREEENFSLRDQFTSELPKELGHELLIRERENRLTLQPAANPMGMPQRHRRPPRATLQPGEWLRWSINYRFGLDYGWLYRLDTYNVAYGVDSVGDLFTGEPPRIVDELAALR